MKQLSKLRILLCLIKRLRKDIAQRTRTRDALGAEITRLNAEIATSTTNTDIVKYVREEKDYRLKGIRHEDTLVHQRINGLLILNGFLFAFMGQLTNLRVSKKDLRLSQSLSELIDINKNLTSIQKNITPSPQIDQALQLVTRKITDLITSFSSLSGAFNMTICLGIGSSFLLFLIVLRYINKSKGQWASYNHQFPHSRDDLREAVLVWVSLFSMPFFLCSFWVGLYCFLK